MATDAENYIAHVINYRLEGLISMRDPIVTPAAFGGPETVLTNELARAILALGAGTGGDSAPIIAAVRGEGQATRAEIRATVADGLEGGAERVRANG